jgi:hypothetical protein
MIVPHDWNDADPGSRWTRAGGGRAPAVDAQPAQGGLARVLGEG